MTRGLVVTVAFVLTLGSSSPLAYLKLGAMLNGRVIDATWKQQPIGYFISDRPGNGVTPMDLLAASQRATATWSGVESAAVRFAFQGMTSAPAEGIDGMTTFGFIDRPDLDRVLGATSFLIDTTTGEIAEADIFFNSRFAFSVAPNGQADRVDLESVVLGAHVVAFNPETGVLIGNFTLNASGDFVIARLPPGPYILRVEPIDDAEPESFFPSPIDTDFRVTYAPRMVVAPHGGSSPSIEIRVQPR